MIDPRQRFSGTSEDYERYRPSYPPGLFDWLAQRAGTGVVADMGCGTGISTRLLARCGWCAIGVEPNAEMLAAARRSGGAEYRPGEARSSGLDTASVDLVSAFQAFHWFDLPAAFTEFRRILRPGGACAAVWNSRVDTPFLAGYEALLRRHCSDYGEVPGARETIARIKGHPEVRELQEAVFPNRQVLDLQGLLGRARSASYVRHGLVQREAFFRELEALFLRHRQDGRVELRYECLALLFRLGG